MSDEIVSVNPATGEEVGRVSITSPDEVCEAVQLGRDAFSKWKLTSFDDRKRLVMRARDVVLAAMDDIAERAGLSVGLLSARSSASFSGCSGAVESNECSR